MNQPQPFNKKKKSIRHQQHDQKSIFVKDLPIQDFRYNLDYITELHEPVVCKGTPVNGFRSKADVLGKVVFKVFMSYSEASQLSHTSHPLQNMILKPGNYLEGPKPGVLKKMINYSLPLNDYGAYEVYIPEVKKLEDLNTVKMINWLWVSQRHNYDAWMKMIEVMVLAQSRMLVGPIENDFIKKCLWTRASVNGLIGPRGLCHGFCDLKVPKLEINQSSGLYSKLPRWALDFDDDSSYHLSSPDNSDFDTDSGDSGPIGVACNRPRITGFTSFTETSSESSSETSKNTKASRLDVFIDGHSGDYWDRRMRKRFDLYIQTSLNERRNRRAIREARRKVRLQYNRYRRMLEPSFNAEAKRAEALAAERVRADIRNRKAKERVNNNAGPRGKSIKHYLYRYKKFNHQLKSQLECSWTRYYGKKIIPNCLDNPEDLNDISLKCWVSPVPFIEQNEINNGFAAVSMALCQMTLIEVILGEDEGRPSDEPRKLLQLFPNGAKYFEHKKKMFELFGVKNVLEWHKSLVSSLIFEMTHCGMTNWGEIFCCNHLQHLAKHANKDYSRYNIRLVESDLLANYKNNLSPEGQEANKSTENNSLSIVQRLVRGQLIAVCYDADEKKRPTKNGGRSARWALLCGVIVGFPSKEPQKKPLQVEELDSTEMPYKDKELAYVYHYEPKSHLLTPKGFISRETDKPVTIKTIKERAVLVDEEPNDNGDKHSKNCNEGRQKCQKCTIEYVDKELDLERDADNVWVVVRDGDGYVVWTLRELANSNRQLHTPGKEILNTIPRQLKHDWLFHDEIYDWLMLSESMKLITTAYSQRNLERLSVKRRKNRALCRALVDQMDALCRKHPYNTQYELVEMLNLSKYSSDSAEMWKSAARVAYNTYLNLPFTEPMSTALPLKKEPTHQMPVAPPPLPIPTSPTPVTPPMNNASPNPNRPYLIHGSPDFRLSLAQQYVCFEPLHQRYKNNGMDHVPDVNNLNDTVLMAVDFYFSIDGKLPSGIQKKERCQRAKFKNCGSTPSKSIR